MGSTHKLLSKLFFLSSAEVGGIPGVAVECVDIGRNTSGETTGRQLTLRLESVGSKQDLDTLVHTVNDDY